MANYQALERVELDINNAIYSSLSLRKDFKYPGNSTGLHFWPALSRNGLRIYAQPACGIFNTGTEGYQCHVSEYKMNICETLMLHAILFLPWFHDVFS